MCGILTERIPEKKIQGIPRPSLAAREASEGTSMRPILREKEGGGIYLQVAD